MSHPARLEVLPLGTGNFFSSRRYCTSLLLLAGDEEVLIDCPEPFFRVCSEAAARSGRPIDPSRLDDIILTHLHGDHSNGLEGLGFWRKFSCERKVRPRIYTSPPVGRLLWGKLAPAMAEASFPGGVEQRFELSDYYDLRVHEFGSRFTVGGIEIETRRTIHSVPCFGLRATFGGRRFGYSCDTSFDPEHVAFLKPCDLIFHECDDGMHTPLQALEGLPEPLRKKMRLIHLGDAFPGSRKIEAAEEGRVYPV